MNKWISVSEELPLDNEVVVTLIYHSNEESHEVSLMHICDEMWRTGPRDSLSDDQNVTHWCRLPQIGLPL